MAPDWSDFEPMREEDEEITRFIRLDWLFLLKCPEFLLKLKFLVDDDVTGGGFKGMTSSDESSPRVQTNEFSSSQHSSAFERPQMIDRSWIMIPPSDWITADGETLNIALRNRFSK